MDQDGGFRDQSDYRQAKVFLKYADNSAQGRLEVGFTGTLLAQETAGFVLGENAYADEAARLTNANPESYRDANSQRLSARWQPATNAPDAGWDLRAFVRRSDMDFLQHFLPGQPVEKTGKPVAG